MPKACHAVTHGLGRSLEKNTSLIFHENVAAAKATAATLSDHDGVARTPEAVWDWAEALARQNATQKEAAR